MIRTCVAAVLALTIAAPALAAAKPVKSNATPAVVIGYIPTFKDYRPTLDVIDMSKLTHINISFVNPDAQGRFVNGDLLACSDGYAPGGGMLPAEDIRNIVAKAHKHGVKVLVSLGAGYCRNAQAIGWTCYRMRSAPPPSPAWSSSPRTSTWTASMSTSNGRP